MRLALSFFCRDVLDVAPELLGKILVRMHDNGIVQKYRITETEAYRGEEDEACHVSKGQTKRTEVMYDKGGLVYVYLIYGMYQMLNVVTAEKGTPQAVLIRGIENYNGPGKLTKHLDIDKTFYGEDLCSSNRLWIEDDGIEIKYVKTPRIGIDYAGRLWREKKWRFVIKC